VVGEIVFEKIVSMICPINLMLFSRYPTVLFVTKTFITIKSIEVFQAMLPTEFLLAILLFPFLVSITCY
jgi:hypothetical protein